MFILKVTRTSASLKRINTYCMQVVTEATMVHTITLLSAILVVLPFTSGLDNGLAATPPMGWLSWQRFRCNLNCKGDPYNCLSENLIKRQADCMVKNGYLEVGYQYIAMDDCWPAKSRDENHRLVPDPQRFPAGMKALGDYVHSKGLKFGLYEDVGTKTCGGYPGSAYYMQMDAETFAEWGVDWVKIDRCNSALSELPYDYPALGYFLNQTGRHILYSCEWPVFDVRENATTDFAAVRRTCNMWRNYFDVDDSWTSVKSTINYFAEHNDEFQKFAGPGGWNDPDMLVIGNYGLSYEQERTQMAMWAIWASPMIMSVDLCNVHPWSKEILQNKRVIAVNQDKLGIQGKLIMKMGAIQVWARPILPEGSHAIVFVNLADGGSPKKVEVKITKLGLTNEKAFNMTETFDGVSLGIYKQDSVLSCWVNPNGVYMVTAAPHSG